MDESAREDLVNKTIQSFVLKMKQNQNVDFEPAQVVQDFMNYAKVNWIWSWNQSQEPEMDYILSSANGKEQRHYLNSSIALN